nr:MAG TPA: prohead serine protease [Caudoviricetes sp.]
MLTKPDRQTRQIRSIPGAFQTRTLESGEPVIEGYFAVFNSDYPLWPGATERVAPGSFADELHADVRALCDHDTRIVLGRTTAGTLTLTEDERGLYGIIKINTADSDAMNLYARVQRGDVSQCSFGFDILDEEYIINPDGSELWLIRKVKLYEVSVVTFPAYEETSVSARSADTPARRERRLAAWKNNMKERLAKCSK